MSRSFILLEDETSSYGSVFALCGARQLQRDCYASLEASDGNGWRDAGHFRGQHLSTFVLVAEASLHLTEVLLPAYVDPGPRSPQGTA